MSKIGYALLPTSSSGLNTLIAKYITIAVIVFLILSAAGPNAPGPLGLGVVQSIKTFLIDTLPFFIIAYGLLSRKKSGLALYTGGLFVLSSATFLILNNLRIGGIHAADMAASWIRNGKVGLTDAALAGAEGLIVATVAIVAL